MGAAEANCCLGDERKDVAKGDEGVAEDEEEESRAGEYFETVWLAFLYARLCLARSRLTAPE